MYFVNSRKRNSDWLVTDDENCDEEEDDLDEEHDYREDTEFNLNLADGKGFTIYDKSDVMVAVAIGSTQNPVEIGSSKKPLIFPVRQSAKRVRVSEQGRATEGDYLEASRSGSANIIDEFFEESDNAAEQPDEALKVTETTEIQELESEMIEDALPGCSQTNQDPSDIKRLKENLESYKNHHKSLRRENPNFKLGLQFYKTENENSYVLHIPCLAIFTFYGKLRFTLIAGKIEVFGYVIDIESNNKTIDVYSPRRFMQIGVKSVLPFIIPDYSDLEAALKNRAMLPEGELSNVMSSFSPDDTLVLVEKLPSNFSPILRHYFDDIDLYFEKRVNEDGTVLEKDLDCLLSLKSNSYKIKTFTEGCEWKQIKAKKCTVICGGKGVGKSTLLKYLINRTLSNKEKVLYIDLDPGQTEFTPSGFVSAVILEKPLLGPGFTHITKPFKMAYIGSINVALDPLRYMKSVNYILQSCKHDPVLTEIPWFINTMGFNKDIGLDIMINVIKLFRPDVVIQINSSEKARNYSVCLTANIVEIQPVINLVPAEDDILYHDLIKIESSARMRELALQSGFKPSQVRDLMTLSYFSPLLTFPYYDMNAVQPRWVRLTDIFLAVHDPVPPRSILKAFNGSLVALCNLDGISCTERLMFGNADELFCKIAVKPDLAPSFGLGIVRAIDVKQKKVYIITHLSDRELSKVNCLYMGTISLPPSLFLNQTFVDEPTIYTDVFEVGNNQKLKRVFKYVPHYHSY